jgi:hypothetical protein
MIGSMSEVSNSMNFTTVKKQSDDYLSEFDSSPRPKELDIPELSPVKRPSL